MLKYDDPETGDFFTLGQLRKNGCLVSTTSTLYKRFHKHGWPIDACIDYLDEVASLIPGAIRKSSKARSGKKSGKKLWEAIVYGKNPGPKSYPPFELLNTKKEGWFDAITKLINRIQALSENQE
jgi:hypothetical protein